MPLFRHQSLIAAPPARVFAFHEAPDALTRLIPPWERARVVRGGGSLAPGAEVELQLRVGPLALTWLARHTLYQPGVLFQDVQLRGPFRRWVHTHRTLAAPGGGTLLVDEIEFELPFGPLGRLLGERAVRARLLRTFAFRHRVTAAACAPPG
jgi:ligand-binding SRPBCC domain-containing protein